MRYLTANQTAVHGALLLGAGLAGIAVAATSWKLSVLFIVLMAGTMVLAVAKAALRPAESHALEGALVSTEDARFRLPRRLYYLGAATIGVLTVRPALAFTASDWIFFLAFGLTCVVLLTHRDDRSYLIPRAITVGVVLFSVGGLLSSFQALDTIQSASIVVRLLYLTIVWFWLGTILLQTREHIEYALLAWVGSAAFSSAGAVAQFFFGSVIPGGDVAWGRMTGFTPHFNILGGLAATAFVPALMLAVDSPRRSVRVFGIASMGFLGAGLLLSGSVGGLLAASVSTVFWLTIRGVTLRTVVGLGGVMAAGLVLMSASGVTNSPNPLDRITRVTSAEKAATGTGGTVHTRLEGYGQAWARVKEQPLIGVGLDEASSAEALGPNAVHNMLFITWFSAGILGLIGIVLIVAGAVAAGCSAVRYSPRRERSLRSALLASVVAFVVFGMGEPILFVRYGWFPTALLIAIWAQQLRATAPIREPVRFRRAAMTYSTGGYT